MFLTLTFKIHVRTESNVVLIAAVWPFNSEIKHSLEAMSENLYK